MNHILTFKYKALYSRLLTQLKVYLKDYLYFYKTWELAVVGVLRVWQRKVNSCLYFRVKKIWQNEGGGPSPSAGQAPTLRLCERERHRRFNYSYSASSNTWECSQCWQTASPVCFISPFLSSSHAKHLRHLPAVSQSENSRGYPRRSCYRETWGCPSKSKVNFGRVLNGLRCVSMSL